MSPRLRRYEWIVVAFFVYIALLAIAMGRWVGVAAAVIGMAMVIGLARVDVVAEATWSRRLRDWMAPGYILAAYWSLEPLARGQESRLYDGYWVQWDRALLYGYGLRPVVELAGPAFPFTLELVYLLLYGLPTAMIGWFYYQRRRDRLNDFLEVLFASALLTYALIPLMPSAPPHLEFPHADLPQYLSVIRRLNLWLQKSADITAGVFPSGHVTVGVACWLGFRRAMPQRIGLQRSLFVYVVLLMLATIYGRYHYVVDVVAAVVVSGISFALVERYAPASGVAKRAEVVAAANLV